MKQICTLHIQNYSYLKIRKFCAWFQGELEDNNFIAKSNTFFSDAAMFTSNGTDSSENFGWWCAVNAHFILTTPDQYYFKTNSVVFKD